MSQFSDFKDGLPPDCGRLDSADKNNGTAELTVPYAVDQETLLQQLAEHPATRDYQWQLQCRIKKYPIATRVTINHR